MGGVKIVLKQKVENNNLIFELPSEPYKSQVIQVLSKCNEKCNGFCSLTINRPYKPRTLKENSKYWAMCSEYGLYVGMTREEVSDGVKVRAVEERGYPVEVNRISKQRVPLSIAKASTVEQSILIEMLYQIASEDGYVFDEDKVYETSKTFNDVKVKESSNFTYEEEKKIEDDFYEGDIF